MNNYWVDGHYVFADTPEEAVAWVFDTYGHRAESVRPWTDEDQAELDRQTA